MKLVLNYLPCFNDQPLLRDKFRLRILHFYIFSNLFQGTTCVARHTFCWQKMWISQDNFYIFSNLFWGITRVARHTYFFLAEEVDFSRHVSLYMHNIKYVIIYFTWCPRHYYKIDKILRNLSFKSPGRFLRNLVNTATWLI